MTVTIFHNPRCSKSRATLELLKEEGVEPEVVLYLEQPPSVDELRHVIGLLGVAPRDVVRFADGKELGLSASDERSPSEWLTLLHEHPRLLQRPIVVVDNERAAIGRPPEAVRDVL